ncbi:MAG: xanthine dehydrogenase family protein molybdopterin-binding subunit [Acidimicrobiia bacterium]|nr:xanthine dehydrogenase family protein molybdopterin-binding subunit [Acidimicrobiia bacterium]
MTWVGSSVKRKEDPELLTGRARFTADIAIGTRAISFVRSPLAAGVIRSIEAPDGVVMFTGADLASMKPLTPILHRPDYVRVPQPVLALDRVSYVGEPVAMVIAPSRESAEDAADQVFVNFEDGEPVIGLDAAENGDGLTHPHLQSNVVVEGAFDTGGVDDVFATAAEVVEVDIRSRRQNAMPLEARGASAHYDPATGRITLMASTQMPHVVRTIIADLIGMPESDLRVVAPAVGGGFGQKVPLAPESAAVVWAARTMRQSMAWIEDRRENFMASFHARDQRHVARAAFDRDGKLTALDADILCDVGAFSCYPITWGVEPLMAMAELPGPYDLQTYRVRARGFTTNSCPMSPYRGVSRPVQTLVMERIMDIAGERFGVGPLEIRRRNLVTVFPYRSATGLTFDEGSYAASMDTAAELVDLEGFRTRQAAARSDGRLLGIGFSVFSERTGYGTPAFAARGMDVTPGYETVAMSMDPSGHTEVRIGASPHGQGLVTTLSQLVADRLGVSPDTVTVVHSDTDRTPYGWGTFASRSMVISGGATQLAADDLASTLRAIAAELLEASESDMELVDGQALVRGTDVGVPIPELARVAYHQSHRLPGGFAPGLSSTGAYDPPGTFSNACHVAVVEVDAETAGVKLERFIVVEDAGVLINPMIVEGQIAGGVTQGIANALFEEVVYDETGNILTTSLMDYLPPTAAEIPPIEIKHLETITDASVTGAKGIGEGGTIGAPAAVINAVSDALRPLGIEVFEMPITPDRISALMRSAKGATP